MNAEVVAAEAKRVIAETNFIVDMYVAESGVD